MFRCATFAALIFAGCATEVTIASADIATQSVPFVVQSATGSGCPGSYTGYSRMTNSLGTFPILSETNDAHATFTDASGFSSNYVSVVQVTRVSDNKKWCDTNSVIFPATNGGYYKFTTYVKSPLPPPTNSQDLNLQIKW